CASLGGRWWAKKAPPLFFACQRGWLSARYPTLEPQIARASPWAGFAALAVAVPVLERISPTLHYRRHRGRWVVVAYTRADDYRYLAQQCLEMARTFKDPTARASGCGLPILMRPTLRELADQNRPPQSSNSSSNSRATKSKPLALRSRVPSGMTSMHCERPLPRRV